MAEAIRIPVSVVIPAFNVENYIADSIISIWGQDAVPNEIIVVDDGSTDRTAKVAEENGARVIVQKNKGAGGARNAGIAAAESEWIAFLDADDAWLPDKMARQWEAHQLYPEAGLSFTDFSVWDGCDIQMQSFLGSLEHYRKIKKSRLSENIFRFERDDMQRQFHKGNFIRTSTVMVRREHLLNTGMFDLEVVPCEDREMWLRLLKVTDAVVVETPLVRYLDRAGSLSSDSRRTALAGAMIADRVVRNPERYPVSAVEYYGLERANHYLNAGRWAEEDHDYKQAGHLYWRSFSLGGGLMALVHVVWAGCRFALAQCRTAIGQGPHRKQ